jgi:hypothetical protein
MVLLDGTITIVALPSIGAGLRFSGQGLQWVKPAHELPEPDPAADAAAAEGVVIRSGTK